MSRPPVSSPRNRGHAAGFTLVEVLVALGLLSTALVPAFVLASNAVSLSAQIRNDLIATSLAQEGVEVVRAIRDANWFTGQPLEAGLDTCDSGCTFQYDSDGPESNAPGEFLQLDPDTGVYRYGVGGIENNTLFKRTVTIELDQDPNPAELIVTSRVEWRERTRDKQVTVEYHLFDWLQ